MEIPSTLHEEAGTKLAPRPAGAWRSACVGGVLAAAGWAFDIGTAVLSVADVVSDVLVAVQFAQGGQWVWFSLVVASMFVASCVYTVWFNEFALDDVSDRLDDVPRWVRYPVAFVLAQLLPTVTWVAHFWRRCRAGDDGGGEPRAAPVARGGGEGLSLAAEEEVAAAAASAAVLGRLERGIQQHMKAHAMFYVETVVEAVPQSVVQMLAMTFLGQASGVQVISTVLSLVTITSKAYVVCRCCDLRAFVFKFLLVAHDVFSLFFIFATLLSRDGPRQWDLFGTGVCLSFLSATWALTVFAFVGWVLLAGAGVLAAAAARERVVPRRATVLRGLGIVLLGVLVSGPALLAVLTLKCSWVVLADLKNQPGTPATYPAYSAILAFLRRGESCYGLRGCRSARPPAPGGDGAPDSPAARMRHVIRCIAVARREKAMAQSRAAVAKVRRELSSRNLRTLRRLSRNSVLLGRHRANLRRQGALMMLAAESSFFEGDRVAWQGRLAGLRALAIGTAAEPSETPAAASECCRDASGRRVTRAEAAARLKDAEQQPPHVAYMEPCPRGFWQLWSAPAGPGEAKAELVSCSTLPMCGFELLLFTAVSVGVVIYALCQAIGAGFPLLVVATQSWGGLNDIQRVCLCAVAAALLLAALLLPSYVSYVRMNLVLQRTLESLCVRDEADLPTRVVESYLLPSAAAVAHWALSDPRVLPAAVVDESVAPFVTPATIGAGRLTAAALRGLTADIAHSASADADESARGRWLLAEGFAAADAPPQPGGRAGHTGRRPVSDASMLAVLGTAAAGGQDSRAAATLPGTPPPAAVAVPSSSSSDATDSPRDLRMYRPGSRVALPAEPTDGSLRGLGVPLAFVALQEEGQWIQREAQRRLTELEADRAERPARAAGFVSDSDGSDTGSD